MVTTTASKLGSTYKGHGGGGSAIPTPGLGGRRGPRSATPASSSGASQGSALKSAPSATNSRSTSPANGNASFIPGPGRGAARATLNEKHGKMSGPVARSSLRAPTSGSQTNHVASPYHASSSPQVNNTKHKDSMLDKFKLFNHKDKEPKNKTNNTSGSKRTSSSSGFSSARSERSDSSTSLCSDAKPPPLPPHQSLPVSSSSSSSEQTHQEQQQQEKPSGPGSKPQGLRGIRLASPAQSRSKFTKSSGKEGKESPKSSRKDKEESRSSPRSGNKSHRSGDQRGDRSDSHDRNPRRGDKLTLELNGGSKARPQQPLPAGVSHSKQRVAALVPRPDPSIQTLQDRPPALPPKEASRETGIAPPLPANPPPALPQYHQEKTGGSTPSSPLPPGTLGKGLPKPTAHVKGQAKSILTPVSPTSSPNVNLTSQNKDYNKMVRQSSSTQTQKGIPTDVGQTTGTPGGGDQVQEIRDPKGSLPRQKQLSNREESSSNISVGIVSPMPKNREKEQVTSSESGSNISESNSSHSNSGQSNSNSSGNSSVIYKPTSSEDESSTDFKTHIIKSELEKLESEEGDEVIFNIKPMQPLVRASQYGYMRGLGQHPNRTVPPSLHVSRMALLENSNTVPQKGMRLSPHLKRPPGGPNDIISESDYSDLESIGLANGYMSDGDVLRSVGYKSGNSSDLDGYLSEGGASLYAHRLNQRFKEGMRQVHESMNRVQHFIQDDSFDDSSSMSSGVSDNLNDMSAEDVLSSSFSDHQSVTKTGRNMKEVGLKLPVGLSGSSRKVGMGADPSGMYKVVSSRAHVKRTESAQQTENSAFKQISNTQWKKYVENGKGSLERSTRELQKGLEQHPGSANSRKTDQKRSNMGSPQTSVPNSPGLNACSGISSPLQGSRKLEKKGLMGEKRREDRSSRDKSIGSMSPQLNGDSKKLQSQKTVPSNFSYGAKKSASSGTVPNTSTPKSHKGLKEGEATAIASHSLERPRTKLKVSGGTQTTSDLQYMPSGVHSDGEYSSGSLGRKYQLKSYSLNGPVAAQLSQSVRERIMQSPYSKVHVGEYGQFASSPYYRERSPRKITDGSLSDSPYSNYAELQYTGSPYSSPYSWVARGSNYATSVASAPTRPVGGSLTEAESMESISSSASSSMAAQLQQARDSRLTQARLMMHQREMSTSPSPRIARSNSVRSTKSEKLYSQNIMGGREGYHMSQPTSPTPPGVPRVNMSPLNTVARGSPYYSPGVAMATNDEECVGSQLSLVSTSSSLYSSQEDKQASEIRKLRRDLIDAQGKVGTLTNQLTTNAHVVAAFEQSLTNMTNRLRQLTSSSEQKDSEVYELKKTIEALRQQSIEAGLTVACLQSRSCDHSCTAHSPTRPLHHLPPHSPNNASCSVLNISSGRSRSSSPEKSSHDYKRRHTFTGNAKDLVVCDFPSDSGGNLVRGMSVESVSSLSSACSATSHTSTQDKTDKSNKKKGWLRSSFSKAFSRGQKKSKGDPGSGSVSDMEGWERGECSIPSSPMLQRAHSTGDAQQDAQSYAASDMCQMEEKEQEVEELKQELQKKDMILTDIRLEALSSAHHLESLKETIAKMRNEMVSLKKDNERLQHIVISKSLTSSQNSLPTSLENADQRLSMGDDVSMPDSTDVILIDPKDKDGKRVSITVFMGCHGEYEKYICPIEDSSVSECVIGAISISGKTKWDILDSLVKRIFKEYILRVDPVSNLGLSADSITSYHLGEISRGRDSEPPELLPCGYLVGEVINTRIILKGASINQVDALAFETLIPKSIVQRYVSLLTEHRRIILCGPSGTGKTYLSHKLAEFLVTRLGKDPSPGNIATLNVDHKTGKDLGAYLSHISEQCENNASDLPLVIILDNLHHAGALTDVFNGFLSARYTQCPYIIGIMNQTTSCSTTNLQLHHNFRWVLIANHMEPVKGLVGRIARRKLTQVEVENGTRLPRLQQILDWLPRCWAHINKFLETHSSSDVTIGPRLFLSCPGSVEGSQVWFTDLWNYSLVPYLVEAVREGLQLYGKRATWEDPSVWITETYPWPTGSHAGPSALLSLRAEDVGYDSLANINTTIQEKPDTDNFGENDPLLSMLMRLQEAANYSTPQQESDTTSLENVENDLESTI